MNTKFTAYFVLGVIGLVSSSVTAKDPIVIVPTQAAFAGKSTAALSTKSLLSALVIDALSSTIHVSGAVQLIARSLDENGNALPAETTWSSSDTAVAAVNGAGLVSGVASGAAAITASAS